MNIIKITGRTYVQKTQEVLWEDTSIFIEKNNNIWSNVKEELEYYCQRADSLGYYANNNWNIFIQKYKISNSGKLIFENNIFKFNKELYCKYKYIDNLPYKPLKYGNIYKIISYDFQTKEYNLYYDIDKTNPIFNNIWDAWSYIYYNIEIR